MFHYNVTLIVHVKFISDGVQYTIVWDNVGKYSIRQHQSKERQSKMHMWAMSLAIKNRIPFVGIDTRPTTNSSNIPMSTYLLSTEEWKDLNVYIVAILKRIICCNLSYFKVCFCDVTL